jgi:hypothetical protein
MSGLHPSKPACACCTYSLVWPACLHFLQPAWPACRGLSKFLDHLLKHSRRPIQIKKPKPFHIVVNGLAGSGKSYVISVIEKMLNEYCTAESAGVSRPHKNCGLIIMAHTGKAALNIHGSTIHSALEIVIIYLYIYLFSFS